MFEIEHEHRPSQKTIEQEDRQTSADQRIRNTIPITGRRTLNSLQAGQVLPSDSIVGLRSRSLPVNREKSNQNKMPGPSSGGSGPQASSSTAVIANVGPKHRMLKPGERNAPIFEVDKPEELG